MNYLTIKTIKNMNYKIELFKGFMILHTKFDVKYQDLEKIEGVWDASKVNRYKFNIKVGELFKIEEVKANIEKALNSRPFGA